MSMHNVHGQRSNELITTPFATFSRGFGAIVVGTTTAVVTTIALVALSTLSPVYIAFYSFLAGLIAARLSLDCCFCCPRLQSGVKVEQHVSLTPRNALAVTNTPPASSTEHSTALPLPSHTFRSGSLQTPLRDPVSVAREMNQHSSPLPNIQSLLSSLASTPPRTPTNTNSTIQSLSSSSTSTTITVDPLHTQSTQSTINQSAIYHDFSLSPASSSSSTSTTTVVSSNTQSTQSPIKPPESDHDSSLSPVSTDNATSSITIDKVFPGLSPPQQQQHTETSSSNTNTAVTSSSPPSIAFNQVFNKPGSPLVHQAIRRKSLPSLTPPNAVRLEMMHVQVSQTTRAADSRPFFEENTNRTPLQRGNSSLGDQGTLPPYVTSQDLPPKNTNVSSSSTTATSPQKTPKN